MAALLTAAALSATASGSAAGARVDASSGSGISVRGADEEPDSQTPDGAPLRIVSDTYNVPSQSSLQRTDEIWYFARFNAGSAHRFGVVEVGGSLADETVVFAVEGQPEASRNLYRQHRCCDYLRVGVESDTGKLYLYTDTPFVGAGNGYVPNSRTSHISDFVSQRVELSATHGESPLKVYKDVVVAPPHRPDCSDYPDRDPSRYGCLFLGELLPAEAPQTTAAHRHDLPTLVKPKADYSLVFAEEFDGVPQGDCPNGMATLRVEVWNYNDDPCGLTDADGTPCENVAGGHYYMAAVSRCWTSLSTYGKFEFKYGYVELKYKVNGGSSGTYRNYNVQLNHAGLPLRFTARDYGISEHSGDGYKTPLTKIGAVVNIFEHVPRDRQEVMQAWVQPYSFFKDADAEPRRMRYWLSYCASRTYTAAYCRSTETPVTVTKGIEWTPRGYRVFLKIDGVHDTLTLVPASAFVYQHRPATVSDGKVSFAPEPFSTLTGDFHEHLSSSADSLLMQMGIGHTPMTIDLGSRLPGGLAGNFGDEILDSKMEIDYIRVFQPDGLYTDMEPVYQ
ncbi:hypothetical protein [Candidatus Poriferisodalis sp.]|uniref:hypothetical protein n=1 Tax=Candidatus Poriferisodalis sp. TaxID=3101277 RepID=UPI003B014DE0